LESPAEKRAWRDKQFGVITGFGIVTQEDSGKSTDSEGRREGGTGANKQGKEENILGPQSSVANRH